MGLIKKAQVKPNRNRDHDARSFPVAGTVRLLYSVAVMNKKDQFLRELGQRIADARKSEGLTQAQLGETVGASQQVVADYECGSRHIPVWRLMCVADAMGVDVTELLGTSLRAFPVRFDPAQTLVLPAWVCLAPVAAHHEPLHDPVPMP